MELTELVFTARTDELERASKVIGDLATDLSNLNKVSKEVAQTEATLAKAAKANADANLQNAKAQDVRLKSTIAADKADQSTEKAVKKSTEATERHTRAVKANADILAYQTDRAKFMAEGFSSGNASTLAQAKAVGQLSDELKKILDLQRSFQGNISFDKSDMGIKRLTKSYNEATESQKLFAEGTSLTIEQARELSRDQNRIAASMKFMGKSMDEITAAQRVYANEYNNVASAYNRIDAAEKAVIKQRKEVVSATNYVTQADQRMAAALNVSNVGLDRASSDSLVKYETALRKSGVAQDVLTTKLATYKTQLSQVQAQEQKRAEQHLVRALSPQLTDIGVSLYSGQAPLTVLLQQSGQIVDLFKLSGVEAHNFGKAMRESFYSMIPAISTVAEGMASLAVGMVADAGSALTGFIGKITGITAATEIMKQAIASGGEENFKYIASIQKLGNAFSVVAGVGIAALIAGLVAVGLEYKKILQSEAELSVALATSGGALGFSKDQAVQYAQSLQGVGIGTLKAQEVIAEFAKAGKVGQENFNAVIKSAVELEKTAGVAIEETAKQFAKLQDAPSKTLTEIAEKTGLVDATTLDLVRSLEQQGEKAEAANVATLAFASANIQAANEVRSNWSPLEVLWNDIKSALGRVKQEIYEITTSNLAVGSMKTVWETFAVTISEVWFVLKGIGRTIGGVFAMIAAGSPTQAANIWKEMGNDSERLRSEHDKLIASIMKRSDVENKSFNQSKKQQSDYAAWLNENDKALDKSISKKEQYAIKEKQLQKDLESGLIKEVQYNAALAGWKKIIFGEEKKKKDTKTESFFESSMKALRNNTIEAAVANDGLVESQVKLLQIIKDPAFAKMTEIQKIQIMQAGAAAIATEQQAEAVKQLEKAEEFRLKVLGKSEGVGKQYYSDMEALMKYAKTAGWTTEQVEEMTRALYMQTPAWKEHEKALESSRQALNKFNEESIAYQSGTAKTNEELDYRISLLGKTSEQQKILSIEYQREQKLRENAVVLGKKLRDIEEGITKVKRNGLSESELKKYEDAKVQAIQDSAERERAINRETAVVYAEDLQKEIDAIKSGISDSIVTALFDGGKEGSKKLRQVLVDTLRKKVTVVVDAVVNTLVGNVVGSLFGGAGGGSGGGGGGLLGTVMQGTQLYSGLTSGTGVLGSIGSVLGLGAASSSIGTAAAIGSYAAPSVTAMGVTGIGAGATSGAIAGSSSSLMGALGSIPGWGWALAGAGALAAIFGKKATPHAGAASSYSASGGLVSGADIYATSGLADTRTYNAEVEKVTGSIAQTLGQTLDATAKSFGKSAGFEISTAFADDTSKDGAWGSLVIKQMGKEVLNWADTQVSKWAPKEFADGEEGMKQYLAAVAVSMRDALMSMNLPEWANEMLEAVGDTPSVENLQQVIEKINASAFALDNMRKNLIGFAEYTDSAVSELVKASGGMEGLIASATTYYENFYTEAERAANVTRDITEALAKFGLETPKTREGYRALVEQQQKLGESGAESVAVLLKLSEAFASVTEVAGETISEVQALAKAERVRMQAARDSANKLVEEQTKSFKNLQDSLNKEAFKSKGGMSYGFNVSISEVQSSEKFITALDSATASLAELEKLNLGDEFEKYASEIGKIVQGTKELFATQLANSRLSQGNVSGAIQAKMGASQLNYSEFTKNGSFNAGAFNDAYAKEQAFAAKGLVDVANANALTTANVASVIGQLNAFAQSDIILNEIKQGFIQGVREASNTTSTYVVRDAIQGLAGVFAGQQANQQFLNTSTGLPAIAAAYAAAADMQKVEMIDGARYMGEFSISYAKAISNLNASFNRSKITTDELEGAVKALEESFGELKDYAVTPADIAMSRIGASSNIATEGIKALNLYFGQLSDRAGELAEQAKLASEPIAVVTDVIGRMTSFTDVFATSANAVINGFKGMTGAVGAMSQAIYQMEAEGSILTAEQKSMMMADALSSANMGKQRLRDALTYGSQTRKALLIAQGAGIAGSRMTTLDAAKVAEKLEVNPAFEKLTSAGIRDVSLLLDGLKAFDAASFEKVFIRISDALSKGKLNEEQYAVLFDESLSIFEDYDNKVKQVTDSFNVLRDAAKSLADQLLIDAGYTTLTGSQTLDEAQRQYNAILLRALGGDVTAASDLSGITQQMLDIAKQQATDESTYNRLFGTTISDLRTVESLQTPKVISEPIKVNAETNAELIEQIKLLREEIRASNAQIASNTDKTNKSLQEFQVNGMPTVALA